MRIIMFILLLPAIAALGHDIYLFVINDGIETRPSIFTGNPDDKGILSYFAALGFIWTQYHEESYKWVVQNLDQDIWAYINLLLVQKAVFVGLVFAGVAYAIIFLVRLFVGDREKTPRHMKGKKGSKDLAFESRGKKNTFKYKRK
ncbi:MAG: hypothetical protein DHS20C02_14290 [Micavibrio sp.]|nr:MAG: hypothetical protein DHS20C02_14290 [Micavibrio sp.]